MKFAYVDETGIGDGTTVIIVAVVVDAQRMHITKKEWGDLVAGLARETGKVVKELHFRDFYRGNKEWKDLPGDRRAAGITYVLDWLMRRKHKVTFSGVERAAFDKHAGEGDSRATDVGTPWRAAALHLLLQLQKQHQGQKSNKGQTVTIFDREDREAEKFIQLCREPPSWTDTFYSLGKRQERFDQFVDVPYFADSEHVLLVQAADMIAYLLGRHTKLADDLETPKYPEEPARVRGWVEQIQTMLLPTPCRYSRRGRGTCADFFWELCKPSLREL